MTSFAALIRAISALDAQNLGATLAAPDIAGVASLGLQLLLLSMRAEARDEADPNAS